MLGQLAELVRVRTIIPRRREGDERDALRGRLLGGGRGGDDEGQAEQRHGCVRLACRRGFAGRRFALPCAVKALRQVAVAALGKLLAARGFGIRPYSPGEACKAWPAEMLVCLSTLGSVCFAVPQRCAYAASCIDK